MPRRDDLETIAIIGSGPIVIGQACEFDYSGAQACKALREEGYKVILGNSNPATIMTDPEMADVTYIEPITWQVVEHIIAKERPDAILPTMGGQTALNCALDLHKNGVLAKYNVEMIGANEKAIEKAEDRLKFKDAMTGIGLHSAKSGIAHSLEEALARHLTAKGHPTRIIDPYARDTVVDIDGARVIFPGGWGLVRASNTGAVLVLRFEADSPERLTEIRTDLEGRLHRLIDEVRRDQTQPHG